MKIFDDLHAFIWASPTANNCNTFLIDGEKKILIDPGHYHLFEHVRDGLSKLSLSPQDIDLVIITHGHPDHMEGVRIFNETSTLSALSARELDFVREYYPQYGNTSGSPDFEPHILFQDGDLIVGDLTFQVIYAPGHSPGSICLYWPNNKVLFTGDVIFNRGIGRTDLPGGNGEVLKKSIRRLSYFDVDYLLTGHGEIVEGKERVKRNFKEIESFWFAYI